MKYAYKKIFLSFALAIAVFVFSFHFSDAASYDIYVDKSYSGDDSDGSSGKPYKTIGKALEEAGSGSKKIYIRNGEYSENLTVPKGISLYGQDKNKTIISISGTSVESTTLAKDNNTFKNLTFSGGLVALTIEGKTLVENCIIKNAVKKGISLAENGASATIQKSKLTGSGKGIYAQKGRTIYIYGNEISSNDGEGLDIREKVDGTISGNDISGNGEGGIELIVGSSNLKITGNTIRNNKASGIANQFYPQASKTGKITISKNTITKNGNYGILCGAPSGSNGLSSDSYWNDSLDLVSNKISSNGKKEISGSCELIEAVSEDEKKTNAVSEDGSSSEDDSSSNKTASKTNPNPDENLQNYEDGIEELQKKIIEDKKTETGNLSASILQKKTLLEKNWLKAFFVGYNTKTLSALKEENEKIKSQISILESTLKETKSDEVRSSAQSLVEELNQKISENETFLNQKENSFSLFGWAFKLFA